MRRYIGGCATLLSFSLKQSERWKVLPVLLLAGWLSGCGGSQTTVVEVAPTTSANGWRWELPAFFPYPLVPADNPMTQAKVALGRHLFYDKRLSGNGTLSCGSCHQQAKAFTDGLPVAVGSTGELHPRNTQSLVNVVYAPTLTWANPSLTLLEKQMEVPLFGEHPVEMGVNDRNKAEITHRFAQDAAYQRLFAAAFSSQSQPVTLGNAVLAIAAFERSIVSADSRYDRFLQGKATLSPAETRGMNLFFGEKAECFHCHGSINFNDQLIHAQSRIVDKPFHNTGLYNLDGQGSYPQPNRGVYELSEKTEDMGKFRAPSLRNVAVTAPYNHDGSVATLDAVLANYSAGGRVIPAGLPNAGDGRLNPHRDPLIVRISLSTQEQQDIIAFLNTLTDETVLTDPRFSNPFAE